MISKNQIKYIQSLHSKKNREHEGLFIVEGVKLVSEFISDAGFSIKEVFATKDCLQSKILPENQKNILYTEISQEELNKISLQSTPNKVLAIVHTKTQELNNDLLNTQLTLYLDDIRDPGNLGTIIRIADWFGIKQVVCSEATTELYNPKTLQATMGAILRVNTVYMSFEKLLTYTKQLPIYGAVLSGENIYKSSLMPGIVVIGNEANGISNAILEKTTYPITIPAASYNGSESLNAANACAVICSEFHRQLNYSNG